MLPIPLFVPGVDPEKIKAAKLKRREHFQWRKKTRVDDFMCAKCDGMFISEECHDHFFVNDDYVICHRCYVLAGGVDLEDDFV